MKMQAFRLRTFTIAAGAAILAFSAWAAADPPARVARLGFRVDDAPWGFAVSHYGRWTKLRESARRA